MGKWQSGRFSLYLEKRRNAAAVLAVLYQRFSLPVGARSIENVVVYIVKAYGRYIHTLCSHFGLQVPDWLPGVITQGSLTEVNLIVYGCIPIENHGEAGSAHKHGSINLLTLLVGSSLESQEPNCP